VLADGTLGFQDWQGIRRAKWAQDVGYFLIGRLTEDGTRSQETDLLKSCLDGLTVPEKPAFDEAWARYAISYSFALAIWLSTLGTHGYQPRAAARALVARNAAGCERAGSFSLLAQFG
jgi:hypothetical protein